MAYFKQKCHARKATLSSCLRNAASNTDMSFRGRCVAFFKKQFLISAFFFMIVCSVKWLLLTHFSGQLIGPIFKGHTSMRNYNSTLRKNPKWRRSHFHRGGSLKLRKTGSPWLYVSVLR